MIRIIKSTTAVAVTLLFASCSSSLTGTWSVLRFETTVPGQQGVTLSNIGTMTFNGNGSGEKNLNYNAFGILRDDNLPFSWSQNSKNYVTIESEGSNLSKTWIIIENKKKFQKWKSTDGSGSVQVLELKK